MPHVCNCSKILGKCFFSVREMFYNNISCISYPRKSVCHFQSAPRWSQKHFQSTCKTVCVWVIQIVIVTKIGWLLLKVWRCFLQLFLKTLGRRLNLLSEIEVGYSNHVDHFLICPQQNNMKKKYKLPDTRGKKFYLPSKLWGLQQTYGYVNTKPKIEKQWFDFLFFFQKNLVSKMFSFQNFL